MFEWQRTIQRMVNIIEGQVQRGISDELALGALAKELNYSPYHVTRRFKLLTGITFRSYLRLRRLAHSVAELRDSDRRILDIALKYGFSSQEAFSRTFKEAFGLTPGEYRLTKPPLVLHAKSNIFDPYFLHLGENSVTKKELQPVETAILTMPAHRFLFIKMSRQIATSPFGPCRIKSRARTATPSPVSWTAPAVSWIASPGESGHLTTKSGPTGIPRRARRPMPTESAFL
jgi:AraC-like DNA-binding protein